MSPTTRTRYFALWSKACRQLGWDSKDQDLRRSTVLDCMSHVGGPAVTTSDTAFGSDETTALFVFLDHLAHPSDLEKSAAWVDCRTDYRAYNRARQADWHESKAYGHSGSSRLRKYRFNGQERAAGETFAPLDPDAIQKRYLTMRLRNERRTGYQRRDRNQSQSIQPAVVEPQAVNQVDDGDPF